MDTNFRFIDLFIPIVARFNQNFENFLAEFKKRIDFKETEIKFPGSLTENDIGQLVFKNKQTGIIESVLLGAVGHPDRHNTIELRPHVDGSIDIILIDRSGSTEEMKDQTSIDLILDHNGQGFSLYKKFFQNEVSRAA